MKRAKVIPMPDGRAAPRRFRWNALAVLLIFIIGGGCVALWPQTKPEEEPMMSTTIKGCINEQTLSIDISISQEKNESESDFADRFARLIQETQRIFDTLK